MHPSFPRPFFDLFACPPPPIRSARAEPQSALRSRVEAAIAELRLAHAERDKLARVSPDERNTPESAFAIERAVGLQREASERLRKVVRKFEDFTLRL